MHKKGSKTMDEFFINFERKKSKKERWQHFEHSLRYLLCELKDETDRKDSFLLDEIKEAIIVYVMKDKFEENNEIFLNNMKNDFYEGIRKLEEKHEDIASRTAIIKVFMEDFYFNV